PTPLPASGEREIITLSGPGLYENSGLMTWRRSFDDMRQRVEQFRHLERLAEAWPIGVLAGQHAIAGDKDKRDIPLGQYVCHRVNSLARQIDVEHRHVAGLAPRRIKRLRES